MNNKIYYIQHVPTGGDISVEIDFDHTLTMCGKTYDTMNYIEAMVNFWSGSKKRLAENDGDYLTTFLKQLCQISINLIYSKNLSLHGLIKEFDDIEGWSKMDGSEGIKLTSCTIPDFNNQSDYEVVFC